MSKGNILVVDDDEFFRSLHADILRSSGYDVLIASSGMEAIDIIKSGNIDVVVTDLIMPDINGQDVLERTKQHNALIEVILVTSHGTMDSAIKALKSGAFDYVRKPVNEDELLLSIDRCFEQMLLVKENRGLRQSLKLFKVGRTIASCLEIDKLYRLTLDALLQEIPGDSGLCLFFNKERNDLEIKASKHLDSKVAEKMVQIVRSRCDDSSQLFQRVNAIEMRELEQYDMTLLNKYASIVVAPLKKGETTMGFLLILSNNSKDECSDMDLENAHFIAEQASLSFENAEKYASAKALAYVDSLTDLYNPRFLDIAIDREIRRSNRSEVPFTVLFMDLDYFKNVNDEHGHLVGSRVLIEVSNLLLHCVRDIDTVIRYGGDEYTIVLVDTDQDIAFKVADRIRKTIEEHKFLEDENLDLTVTASIGLATYPTHADGKRALLEMADQAMYHGKNRSRNTVYIANSEEKEDEGV
jgi:diguanylate cyclase (GGDEF)-like protein